MLKIKQSQRNTMNCLVCLVVFSIVVHSAVAVECDLYLAPSTIAGAGRGIMTGRSYTKGEEVEETITISFKDSDCDGCQLNNYAYATENNDFNMLMFGAGVLFNHNNPKSVEYHWASNDIIEPAEPYPEPYTRFTSIVFKTTEDVQQGEELFVDYGDSWLEDRELAQGTEQLEPLKPTNSIVSVEELEKYGHCLSNVAVRESNIEFGGKGLFAQKSFKAGDIVVIAPVLTLSREMVDKTRDSSVLTNYAFTLPDNLTEVVLLPLNNAVALNHKPEGVANLVFHWYDWATTPSEGSYFEHLNGNAPSLDEKLKLYPYELFAASFAQFDIAFAALVDINEGDELTFDYGDSWTEAWLKYGHEMQTWQDKYQTAWEEYVEVAGEDASEDQFEFDYSTVPTFRSYIELHPTMVPLHWLRKNQLDDSASYIDEYEEGEL